MYIVLKRIIDILISIIVIFLMFIPLLFISILIKIESKGSIFFIQERVGKDKKVFNVYKLRTMKSYTPQNKPTWELKNPNEHITAIGSFLRKYSIDEIPQIFNVIKGDMSIVGPRPVIEEEVLLIREREKYDVYSILPGITGLAQINGRDKLDYKKKALLDGKYARNKSLMLDLCIIYKSIIYVLKKNDIIEGEYNFEKK